MIEKLKSRLEKRKNDLENIMEFQSNEVLSLPATKDFYANGREREIENEIRFLEVLIEGNNNLSREG